MHSTADGHSLLVPAGTRLVHVGPPKTATTAVQGAFHAARADLLAQGVRYVGQRRQQARAAAALTRRRHLPSGTTTPPITEWHDLVKDVRRAEEPRVVVSSEFFAAATPDMVRRVVDELDEDRLHVVITLRPLARILPSRWQQNIQMGHVIAFEDWLHRLLDPGQLDPSTVARRVLDRPPARQAGASLGRCPGPGSGHDHRPGRHGSRSGAPRVRGHGRPAIGHTGHARRTVESVLHARGDRGSPCVQHRGDALGASPSGVALSVMLQGAVTLSEGARPAAGRDGGSSCRSGPSPNRERVSGPRRRHCGDRRSGRTAISTP